MAVLSSRTPMMLICPSLQNPHFKGLGRNQVYVKEMICREIFGMD